MSNVHWPLAVSVAARFSGSYPLEGTYHQARLAAQAPGLVRRAADLVAIETGLTSPGDPDVAVVTREEWVNANVETFGLLLAPVEERLSKQDGIGASVSGRFTAVEFGAVLGFLSRRVLGQYELVLPRAGGDVGDTVMLVGANMLALERQFEFRPSEFRFWVALHECTHRAQFVGVPWMRQYFLGLVEELVGSAEPEPGRMGRVASEIREAASSGEPLIDDRGLFGILASPERREVIDRVQALMSLLEGHGHVVMDRIGAREMVTQQRMSEILTMRRQEPRMAMFMRLVGLEMKMKQYEAGARFIQGIERHAGWSSLETAWRSPDHLPTLEEIENPVKWLERVG